MEEVEEDDEEVEVVAVVEDTIDRGEERGQVHVLVCRLVVYERNCWCIKPQGPQYLGGEEGM